MEFGINPLVLMTFFPLVGVLVLVFLAPQQKNAMRWTALGTSLVTFVISLWVLFLFDPNKDVNLLVQLPWFRLAGVPIQVLMGVDGLSILMVLLTTFLTPIAILSTWKAVEEQVKGFMIFFLLLEVGMLGVFLALDLVLFYIFWEFTLIPMYFLIGVWGGKNRIYAAVKFFLFTMAGSVLMLLAILYLGLQAGSFSQPELVANRSLFAGAQIAALPGICPCFCHQSTGVSLAYLVTGCACRSSYCRVCHSGGCLAQDGRLWLPALQSATFPAGKCAGSPGDRNSGDYWHTVWWRGGICAEGYQEAGSLLLGGASGLCDVGYFLPEPGRLVRWHLADAQPWNQHRSPVLAGGDDL